MHLLFVTSLVPDGEPASGYEIANAAIFDALAANHVRATTLGFVTPGKRPLRGDETVLLGEIDPRIDTADAATKLRWLAKSVVHGLPFACGKLRRLSLSDLDATLQAIGPVDGLVLNGTAFSGAFEEIFTEKPFVFVAHNVEFRSAAQNADVASSALQRFMYQREARLLEGLERRLASKARHVFALTEDDRAELCGSDSERSSVLPLTTMRAIPRLPERQPSCELALLGTWTWMPNRVGLEWFCSEVVPLLPDDYRIRVGGSTPEGLKQRFSRVDFVGRVPDAIEFVRSAAVVPLTSRAGTGVQLKTIEAFELGLPCVATTSSMRGLSWLPDNCTVTDKPREFADAIKSLVERRRSGEQTDVDGGTFHARHQVQLHAAIAQGLRALEDAHG
jgi:hypothetical protein